MTFNHRKYRKALETLTYVAKYEQRNYWVLKTIYFANIEHLKRYGRQVFEDSYRAMKHGPVPSLAYDIVKCVRGDGWYLFEKPDPATALEVPDKRTVNAIREPDMRFLSKTDIECLDYALKKIGKLSFAQLKKISHDEAYNSVTQDEEISLESIISSFENSSEVKEYLKS